LEGELACSEPLIQVGEEASSARAVPLLRPRDLGKEGFIRCRSQLPLVAQPPVIGLLLPSSAVAKAPVKLACTQGMTTAELRVQQLVLRQVVDEVTRLQELVAQIRSLQRKEAIGELTAQQRVPPQLRGCTELERRSAQSGPCNLALRLRSGMLEQERTVRKEPRPLDC
jgi:hypothetical protein